jgi:hypothetical protein
MAEVGFGGTDSTYHAKGLVPRRWLDTWFIFVVGARSLLAKDAFEVGSHVDPVLARLVLSEESDVDVG